MSDPNRNPIQNVKDFLGDVSVLVELANESETHANAVRQLIGQRERMHALFAVVGQRADRFTPESLRTFTECVALSDSEFFQDMYCMALNGGKRDGFFVEFGACDGKIINNTILMEQKFGWTGILSEPSPYWHDQLRANRTCMLETRCVWHTTGETVTFAEYADDGYMTQSSVLEDGAAAPVNKSYDVETVSLLDMLNDHNAPREIDFISIDVEGAEFEMIRNFDFSQYRFNYMSIEHLHVPADDLTTMYAMMADAGYRHILKGKVGHDSVFVPADTAEDLPQDF